MRLEVAYTPFLCFELFLPHETHLYQLYLNSSRVEFGRCGKLSDVEKAVLSRSDGQILSF
jgi:hypothetical protein